MLAQLTCHLLRVFIMIIIGVITLESFADQAQDKSSFAAPKAKERLLMDIKQLASGRLITVGERGHILVSDDQGNSWQQKTVHTQALLTKLFFVNEKLGWAVGHQQTILVSRDGGESWQIQHTANDVSQPALFDVWFSDEQNGFAVGAYGLYLATEDGGQSWQPIYQERLADDEIGLPHFYSISYDKQTRQLFMAGELGFLAKSIDKGQTWEKLTSPYHGSFFNIASLENGHLMVMGLRGHLFRSTDSGENWQPIETNTISGLQELTQLDDKQIIIVGSDGTLLISDDVGENFKLRQRSDRVHLAHALKTLDGKILLVGVEGIMPLEQ
ncbi:WD40/YVTN/BNR-like repeat-containing protein [Aliikangiella maris]|uniref:YCF48-related protein n=2 Tax=Aliikangiella maris TaxID=3162458 RepID=A0ABV3MRQ6_9GAMM